MDQSSTTREWLGWLTRVRLLTILLILVVDLIWPQYVLPSGANRYFLPILLIWVTLAVLHIAMIRWLPGPTWQGALQVAGDVLVISALVYTTGLQESYF